MSPRAACRLESMGFEKVGDYAAGEADWIAAGLPIEGKAADEPRVGEVLSEVPRIPPQAGAAEAAEVMRDTGWNTAMVVNGEGIVLGRLYASRLDSAGGRVLEVMQEGPSTVRASMTVHEAMHVMEDHDLDTMPVTTADGKLLGMVLREHISS